MEHTSAHTNQLFRNGCQQNLVKMVRSINASARHFNTALSKNNGRVPLEDLRTTLTYYETDLNDMVFYFRNMWKIISTEYEKDYSDFDAETFRFLTTHFFPIYQGNIIQTHQRILYLAGQIHEYTGKEVTPFLPLNFEKDFLTDPMAFYFIKSLQEHHLGYRSVEVQNFKKRIPGQLIF